MLALDTEDNSKGEVSIINFFNGVRHYTFTGKNLRQNAWDWLKQQDKEICWAVNAEYDIINLFGAEWLGRIVTLQYVSSGLMRAFYKEAPITFYDTLRHWSLSVAAMGRLLKYPKLEMPHLGCNCKKCQEYCKVDTEICWRFVAEMLERYEWLGLKLRATLPAMAMQLFKKFYREEFDLLPQHIIKFFREGYYGGRVEVFRFGEIKKSIRHYDVNSLFPSVMYRGVYPVIKSWHKTKNPNFSNTGVCRCVVEVPESFATCLPARSNNEILFPWGNIEGVWTYAEINNLLSSGGQVFPIDAIEFSDTESPFDDYIDFCYKERLKATGEVDKIFWKLFMNSLYGKFGQSRGITTIYFDQKKREVVEREIRSEAKTSNVIWSAYTTSLARIKLFDYIRSCAEIFYTDTDSLFTTDIFPVSTELGGLKLEGTYANAEFKGNKIYVVDQKAKAKGVRQEFASDFIRTGRAVFRRPARFRESRKTFLKANVWYETEKNLKAEYTKREILADGQTKAWNWQQYKKLYG